MSVIMFDTCITEATVADSDATTVGAGSNHMTVDDVVALRATLLIDAEAATVVKGCFDPQGEDCGVWAS